MAEFPCEICGSPKNFHRRGCSLKPGGEPIEAVRTTAEVPKVGEWYVLRLFMPMGFDIEKNRKTYTVQLTMAQVKEVHQHGRDFRVVFDMDEQYKEFSVPFEGDLFTRADVMVKALRGLAELVEKGSE